MMLLSKRSIRKLARRGGGRIGRGGRSTSVCVSEKMQLCVADALRHFVMLVVPSLAHVAIASNRRTVTVTDVLLVLKRMPRVCAAQTFSSG